jgi:hypothetical protein
MTRSESQRRIACAKAKLRDAMRVLSLLGFEARQSNEIAGYTLLALLGLKPEDSWSDAGNPLRGITPIIEYIATYYHQKYAPNTRETIRDEAVKYFVEFGVVLRNPDKPGRPTNSGKTVYKIEPAALKLFRSYGSDAWASGVTNYLAGRIALLAEIRRERRLTMVPVKLPAGETVTLSPGGQNPLIKAIIEQFCCRFVQEAVVVYIGDTENKFRHLHSDYLAKLGITIEAAAKMPDVVVHDAKRNWLLLIEAVTSAGPVDGKRRKELKGLFRHSSAGLVFVTAFQTRKAMQSFLPLISWESEVWIAEDPDHIIHFNGERFLGPYPDVTPTALGGPG